MKSVAVGRPLGSKAGEGVGGGSPTCGHGLLPVAEGFVLGLGPGPQCLFPGLMYCQEAQGSKYL